MVTIDKFSSLIHDYGRQKSHLKSQQEFVYSANAHPELIADGILITYNVNNGDFGELVRNENIYFPKSLRIKLSK
jgi:hypothetical protein